MTSSLVFCLATFLAYRTQFLHLAPENSTLVNGFDGYAPQTISA